MYRILIKSTLLLLLIFDLNCLDGQTLSIGAGAAFTHTDQKVKMINSKEDFQNTSYYFAFSYEQYAYFKKISFGLEYFNYPGTSFIKFREGSVISFLGNPTTGIGYSGIKVHNVNLNLLYNLFASTAKFLLKPIVGISFQLAKPTGWGFYDLEPPNGPDYVQTAPMRTEAFKTFQVLPTLGIKAGFVFWKRLELGLDIQGAYGFKPFQRMYFTYSYKGVPQETAIFETTGTGIFATINLGYRLVKLKE